MADSAKELQYRELMDSMKELRKLVESLNRQLAEKDAANQVLQEQVAYLQKKLFGPSSEKRPFVAEGQLGLFDEAEVEAANAAEPEPDAEEETVPLAKPRKPKTPKEVLLKGLPVKEKIIELPQAERICKECGTELKPAGKKFVRDEWNFTPAKLTVTKIYVQTYYCPECKENDEKNILVHGTAPEALIPHSMASASVVAHGMYQKYANAVPLYRQEKDWKQYGAMLSRTRLANWIIVCADEYFVPVYEYFHRLLLKREFLMADETRIQVLKESDRNPETESYMWLFRTGEDGLPPIILYRYTQTRARHNAASFLKGFSGYLTTDGYQGYNDLPGIKRTCCWAHVRRYFCDAVPQGKKLDYTHPAVQGVVYCDRLFVIEKDCREHGYSVKQRYEYRLKKAPEILAAFWKWLEKQQGLHDPKSRMGKAVTYALNRKPYLETYLEDGRCSFSNNDSENAIRPFCVGRRNWLFSDTPAGANASAIVYTMVEMAKAHKLNVEAYLAFLLEKRPHARMSDAEFKPLLPWSDAARAYCGYTELL